MILILESPFAGDIPANLAYARDCVRALVLACPGAHVTASHLLYTQEGVLDDASPEERRAGLEAGWALYPYAQSCVVALDRGVSPGMIEGVKVALRYNVPVWPVTLQNEKLYRVQEWLQEYWSQDLADALGKLQDACGRRVERPRWMGEVGE